MLHVHNAWCDKDKDGIGERETGTGLVQTRMISSYHSYVILIAVSSIVRINYYCPYFHIAMDAKPQAVKTQACRVSVSHHCGWSTA